LPLGVILPADLVWKGTGICPSAADTLLRASFSLGRSRGHTQTPNDLVPSQAQRKKCHASDGDMITLGSRAAQLNRNFAYASGTENELAHWSKAGLLSGAPQRLDRGLSLPSLVARVRRVSGVGVSSTRT
jgi:hypothetical protein